MGYPYFWKHPHFNTFNTISLIFINLLHVWFSLTHPEWQRTHPYTSAKLTPPDWFHWFSLHSGRQWLTILRNDRNCDVWTAILGHIYLDHNDHNVFRSCPFITSDKTPGTPTIQHLQSIHPTNWKQRNSVRQDTTLQKQMRPRTIQSWVGATKWGQSGHRAHGLAILSEGNLSQMESVALQCVNAHNQTVLEISYKWVKHTKYNNLMQVAASLLWISLSSHIQCKYVSLLLLFPPCLSICISVDLSKYTRYIYSILMEWILWDSCDLLTCLFFSSHVLLLWFVLFSLRLWLWFVLWCSSQCLYPALSLVDISGNLFFGIRHMLF